MACEYCQKISGHSARCPNYSYNVNIKKCNICGDYIQYGEEYIENDDGEYAHIGCVSYFRDLLDFLQVAIKQMCDEYLF